MDSQRYRLKNPGGEFLDLFNADNIVDQTEDKRRASTTADLDDVIARTIFTQTGADMVLLGNRANFDKIIRRLQGKGYSFEPVDANYPIRY